MRGSRIYLGQHGLEHYHSPKNLKAGHASPIFRSAIGDFQRSCRRTILSRFATRSALARFGIGPEPFAEYSLGNLTAGVIMRAHVSNREMVTYV